MDNMAAQFLNLTESVVETYNLALLHTTETKNVVSLSS